MRAVDKIIEHRTNYAGETGFWRFVDNFKTTVQFDDDQATDEQRADLISECARQYEYLRESHPSYFAKLTQDEANTISGPSPSHQLLVSGNFPAQHFSGVDAVQLSQIIDGAQIASGLEMEERSSGQREEPAAAAEMITEDVTEPTTKAKYSANDLVDFAKQHFQQSVGKIVQVTEFGNPAGYFGGTRGNGQTYELALIEPTDEREIATSVEIDSDGQPYVIGTWSIKVLTGPHAGEPNCFVHAPVCYADGLVGGDFIMPRSTVTDLRFSRLSHADLVQLAWQDAKAISDKEIYISHCHGYKNDQSYTMALDPPALVKVEKLSIERYRLDSLNTDYRIERDSVDVDVLDWTFNFETDDPRLKDYASFYADGTAYFQDGRVEPGPVVVGYQPNLEPEDEPTITVSGM